MTSRPSSTHPNGRRGRAVGGGAIRAGRGVAAVPRRSHPPPTRGEPGATSPWRTSRASPRTRRWCAPPAPPPVVLARALDFAQLIFFVVGVGGACGNASITANRQVHQHLPGGRLDGDGHRRGGHHGPGAPHVDMHLQVVVGHPSHPVPMPPIAMVPRSITSPPVGCCLLASSRVYIRSTGPMRSSSARTARRPSTPSPPPVCPWRREQGADTLRQRPGSKSSATAAQAGPYADRYEDVPWSSLPDVLPVRVAISRSTLPAVPRRVATRSLFSAMPGGMATHDPHKHPRNRPRAGRRGGTMAAARRVPRRASGQPGRRGRCALTTERSTRPFGDLLRRARLDAGLSQEALAERAGLSARGHQRPGTRREPHPAARDGAAAGRGSGPGRGGARRLRRRGTAARRRLPPSRGPRSAAAAHAAGAPDGAAGTRRGGARPDRAPATPRRAPGDADRPGRGGQDAPGAGRGGGPGRRLPRRGGLRPAGRPAATPGWCWRRWPRVPACAPAAAAPWRRTWPPIWRPSGCCSCSTTSSTCSRPLRRWRPCWRPARSSRCW